MNAIQVIPATKPTQIEQARALFREYVEATGHCECFDGFATEIAALPGQYAPPSGQLLLGEADSRAAGCVALRKLDDRICEMKRLYVRPEFRGRKLGRQMAVAIIAEARRVGYYTMRPDTLPSMKEARALYQSRGFQSISPYNDIPGAIHLELKL